MFNQDTPGNETTEPGTIWFEPEIIINNLDDKNLKVLYEDGATHYEVELRNGVKHGNFREYLPDGTIRVRGKFKDDKAEGSWKLYDDKENLIEEKQFSEGVEITE